MQVGNIDTALVTVERLEECEGSRLTLYFPTAKPFSIDSQLPAEFEVKFPMSVPSLWPSSGHLQVRNLSVTYDRELPDVLHDISFEVQPAERVGVVGRT